MHPSPFIRKDCSRSPLQHVNEARFVASGACLSTLVSNMRKMQLYWDVAAPTFKCKVKVE